MRPTDLERLINIKQMLLQLSKGQVDIRFPRSAQDDIIEVIGMLITKIAEQKRDYYTGIAEQNRASGMSQFQKMLFLLDEELRIVSVSPDVFSVLGYSSSELIHQSFSDVLPERHIKSWQILARPLLSMQPNSHHKELIFRTKKNSERSYYSTLTTMYKTTTQKKYLVVGVYEPVLNHLLLEKDFLRRIATNTAEKQPAKKQPKFVIRQRDRIILKEIHDYLVKNFDKSFPGLEALAKQFGTNEYKLKNGFKQIYGMSVYTFYREERLTRSKVLLVSTDLTIKQIARKCGYSNSSHFAKDFKRKYGVRPRLVKS